MPVAHEHCSHSVCAGTRRRVLVPCARVHDGGFSSRVRRYTKTFFSVRAHTLVLVPCEHTHTHLFSFRVSAHTNLFSFRVSTHTHTYTTSSRSVRAHTQNLVPVPCEHTHTRKHLLIPCVYKTTSRRVACGDTRNNKLRRVACRSACASGAGTTTSVFPPV